MKPTTLRATCVSLSDAERAIIKAAGTSPLQTTRGQAVAIVLAKTGSDREQARTLLAESYLATTQPSFHLIPRGEAMASEDDFADAYAVLAAGTAGFTNVEPANIALVLTANPATLAPLRMVLGFTHNELAVAVKLTAPGIRVSGGTLKHLERRPIPAKPKPARADLIDAIGQTVTEIMERRILTVPDTSADVFHSKLDKRDTRDGWGGVLRDARDGVPYSALLYQRYVGGVWRQVQDAYSEVKGDALLERPLSALLDREAIPYYRSRSGASGAWETSTLFGLSPGPDFVLPDKSPTVVIESKIGEDGGTVRDKAARIRTLADAAVARGLTTCAIADGKGWRERPYALVDVVIATSGRTYSLETLEQLLGVPEIAALRGTAAAPTPET